MGRTDEMDDETKAKWYRIVFNIKKQFGKKPDLNALLFLIGMRELGQNRAFDKQEKMDLFHLATCKLLSYRGYYELEKTDEEGWPHYRLVKPVENQGLTAQEELLKILIVKYFEESDLIN